MTSMDGRIGLVTGVANDRSFAWFIAKSIIAAGGTCCFTHLPGEKMERRCRKAIQGLGVEDPWLMPMDASNVAVISPSDGKPTRIGYRFNESGKKVRICRRTGVDLDG